MSAFDLSLCLAKKSINVSIQDGHRPNVVLSRPKLKRKSNSETSESPSNSNDMLSFSADDATSESEFDEHPYSIPKKMKTSNSNNYCNQSEFQPIKFTNKKSRRYTKIKSEDNEDPSCWPTSNIENEAGGLKKFSFKARRRGSKCESKNAVMARLNRLKKKKYVADLEERNAKLEADNESLKKELARSLREVSSLKRETVNLRSVIKNSTEIGSLLHCVQNNTNLHVTSSLLRNGSNSEQHVHSNRSIVTSDSTTGASRQATDELAYNDEGMIHELNLFHCEKQGRPTNHSNLSPENSLIDEICDFNFGGPFDPSDNDLLCDLKGEISSNGILNANTSSIAESNFMDATELVRCETPSKDVDCVSNNDFVFDDVGVCFHIANKRVSLEFCESCNRKAGIWND